MRERNNEARSTLGGPRPELEPSPFIDTPATAQATYPQRVTVLIIMQPRRHGFGGHRMTANPVLCVGNDCYVSNGAATPASVMRRAKALGPGNTLGRNAGPCRNQTTCVFRGITLSGPMTAIQPVDMGFLRHDRRETRAIEPDRSCDATGGQLAARRPSSRRAIAPGSFRKRSPTGLEPWHWNVRSTTACRPPAPPHTAVGVDGSRLADEVADLAVRRLPLALEEVVDLARM